MIRNDDLGYPIVIGNSTRAELRRFLRERSERVVVLADRNVSRLTQHLLRGLRGASICQFELGEQRKTLATVERILESLIAAGAERSTTVVGIGGGVAADLFGFAASLCLRGLNYVGVATSLLAMVDAAIGGKTGANLARGKNLAGTFHQPSAVFCELDALRTLPYAQLRQGLAEVVKAAVIEGGRFFTLLEEVAALPFPAWPWGEIVEESVKVKTMHVADDEFENGSREVLNLGHTFAHAIERASRYHVSHGAAVAVGLRAAGLAALSTGRFSRVEHGRILTLLALLGLPLRTAVSPREILAAISVDKKRRNGRLRFVLPLAIGDVERGIELPSRTVRRVLQACVTPPSAREFV